VSLPFDVLKPLVEEERKEERKDGGQGARNSAQMVGGFLIVPGHMVGLETWE
jgi:hypothetical protein